MTLGKENHVEHNFRIEPLKAFAQIGEAIAVAKQVVDVIRQDGIGLATMLNRDRMVQTQELSNDVPPDEAGRADGENSHVPIHGAWYTSPSVSWLDQWDPR